MIPELIVALVGVIVAAVFARIGAALERQGRSQAIAAAIGAELEEFRSLLHRLIQRHHATPSFRPRAPLFAPQVYVAAAAQIGELPPTLLLGTVSVYRQLDVLNQRVAVLDAAGADSETLWEHMADVAANAHVVSLELRAYARCGWMRSMWRKPSLPELAIVDMP